MFSFTVDGRAQDGQVVIELDDPSSTSVRRFTDLCKGVEGVSYKRSKIDAIFEVRDLSLAVAAEGCTAERPIAAMGACAVEVMGHNPIQPRRMHAHANVRSHCDMRTVLRD